MKTKGLLLAAVGATVLFLTCSAFAQNQAGMFANAFPGASDEVWSINSMSNSAISEGNTRDTEPINSASGRTAGSATTTTDIGAVREAVDNFRLNFERQDVDQLKRASWPSMSRKAYGQLRNTFAVLSRITLQEDCYGSPVIMSDYADWMCSEKFGYAVNGESRPTQTHTLQFHLRKVEGKWYVDGRTLASK